MEKAPPLVSRRIGDIADAQASHAEAVLLGIERPERFAEGLAHPVAAVRPDRDIDADALAARIEPDGMIRRGEDHVLDAGGACRLEQVVAADDIGVEDRRP